MGFLSDTTVLGSFGGGGGGGSNRRDAIRRFLEFIARRRLRKGEQEDVDEHRELMLELEQEGKDITAEGYAPVIEATQNIFSENLAEAEGFYNPAEVERRFGDFADPLLQSSKGILAKAESEGFNIVEGFRGMETEGRAGLAQLVQFQQARERRLLAELEGLGDQERRDIGREFAALGGTQQVQIGQLGLAGTAASRGAALSTQIERTEAFGRLDERIRGERLGLSERLSGETLTAQAAQLEGGLSLTRDRIGAQADVTGYLTDRRLGNLGFETELGQAGLAYQEGSFLNLQDARERSLGAFEPGLAFMDEQLDQIFDRVVRPAPKTGLSSEIYFQRGQQKID